MQNSNSMWKMAALAGVVGLGLLIVLQVQQGLTRKPVAEKDAKLRLEDFKPRSGADSSESSPTESLTSDDSDLNLLSENAEPPRLNADAKSVRKLPPLDESELDAPLDEFPARNTPPVREAGHGSSRAKAIAESLGNDESLFDELEPQPKKRSAPRITLTTDEPVAEADSDFAEMPAKELPDTELSFEDTEQSEPPAKPKVTAKADANAKSQAQQLIQLARKLIDNGLLEEARLKAAEAADLPVTYGPLEDTPEAVLEELDRLTSTVERPSVPIEPSIQLTGGTSEKKSSESDLNLDDPFEEVPAKKPASKKPSLTDDDDLLADNPPQTINGKKRPPDPPVPPAEDAPLELEPIPEDSDMPPADPIKPKHKLEDDRSTAPNRLKSLDATPIDSDEKFTGDGTVRPDAPRGPQRPELKIEKVAPPNATLGRPMVYTIVIRNIGDSTAHQVVVEDQIPKGASLSGTIPRAELAGKRLVWRLGAIKPGDQKEIQVKVVPVTEGQIGSIATVNFQAEVASRTTVASPKLSIKLNAPQQVRLGEVATLNFQVTNNGTVDAPKVVLRNLIPENFKLQDVSERDLEYDMGTIPAGKTQAVQLPLTSTRPGKAINRVVLTADGVTAAETQAEIQVIGQLIGLVRHGPSNWFVGRPAEFENRLTNNSLNSTSNTVVVESLPSTVEFVSASDGGRYDARQRTVTWHVPHMDPQQSLTLKLKVTPKSIGSHAGSVQITEAGRKGAATDYQFRAIGAAVLGVEFAEKAEAYSQGEQFRVRMQIRNKGSGVASNVTVRLSVPGELQFVSARGPVSHTATGREIVFEPIKEIGGQGNVAFELTFKALGTGDSKLQVELQSDQFKKPLTHEEPVVIFGNGMN